MNITPSEEQVLLRDTVGRFLADRTDSATAGEGPILQDDWRALGELGLFGFLLPEAAGGLGGGPQDVMIVAEEFGRALAITPLAEGIVGAADAIARGGDAAAIETWVAPAMTGDHVLAVAVADVSNDGPRLTGRADFVLSAVDAAALVVIGDGATWLVERDAEGLSIDPVRVIDGSAAGMMRFDGTPALALTQGDGDTTLAMIRLCHVAELVGAMSTLYEQTVEYVRQRQQFGVAIGTFQVVQHKLARMFVALEQARSLMLKAAIVDRDDAGFVRGVLGAKAYVADAAQRLAEEAVHLHGGMGVTDELPVGRGLRRVILLARVFGSASEARVALAA